MSDQTPTTGNAPSHIVWFVPTRENAPWTRIGAQWPTKAGTGFRQVLEMIPRAEGHIIVLPNDRKNGEASNGDANQPSNQDRR